MVVLASLPTSKDSVPSSIVNEHGCIDIASINFNCYHFQANRNIAHDAALNIEFAFPRDTYVYGFRIAEYTTDILLHDEQQGLTSIEVKGKLYADELDELRRCLRQSGSVKRKYRRLL